MTQLHSPLLAWQDPFDSLPVSGKLQLSNTEPVLIPPPATLPLQDSSRLATPADSASSNDDRPLFRIMNPDPATPRSKETQWNNTQWPGKKDGDGLPSPDPSDSSIENDLHVLPISTSLTRKQSKSLLDANLVTKRPASVPLPLAIRNSDLTGHQEKCLAEVQRHPPLETANTDPEIYTKNKCKHIASWPSFNFSMQSGAPTSISATSKYSRASYSLVNDPDAIELYSTMAEKTNDCQVQLAFAKYLLDVASLYSSHAKPTPLLIRPPITSSIEKEVDTTGPAQIISSPRLTCYLDLARPSFSMESGQRVGKVTDMEDEKKRRRLEREGLRWINRLAKQKVGEAAYIKAVFMEQSKYGLKPRSTQIARLYQIGADTGIPEALYAIGIRQEKAGHLEEAFESYEKAAKSGLVDALYRVAIALLHGELRQRQNMVAGLARLLQASKRATTTCHEPPYTFGLVLTNAYPQADIPAEMIRPYGGPQAAVAHFEHAAQVGNVAAQEKIASIYKYGKYGVSIDAAKAFMYYGRAAKANNAKAMLGLARLYNRGCDGPNDTDVMDRMARDVSGWLAMTPVNEDLAFSWCQRAARRGLPEALYMLGWFYDRGIGVPRDYERAEENYRRASAKGHQGAQERLYSDRSITRQQYDETSRPRRQRSFSPCAVF